MTDKQKMFCNEYLIDMNATRAYMRAYTNCKNEESARRLGSKLLTKIDIKQYVEERINDRQKRVEITQDMVVKELAKIAFLDIRKMYNEDGGLKRIQDIDEDTAGAIVSIESTEEFDGYGENREQIGYNKKVKMSDKTKALELLGKHLGMFKETNVNVNMNYEEYINKVVDEDEY